MPREALDARLDAVWDAMRGCIERGISQDGTLPGGLKVRAAPMPSTTSCKRSGSRTATTRCSPTTGCRSTPWR